jgi:hypothetical protein
MIQLSHQNERRFMMKTYSEVAKKLVQDALEKLEGRYGDLSEITFELEKLARIATGTRSSCERPFRFLEQHGIKTTGDVLRILADIKEENK